MVRDMGLLDDSIRKLGKDDAWARHVKPERLAGPFAVYEGYDEAERSRLKGLAARAKQLQGALDREALAMGAIGLAVGVLIGVAVMSRRNRD